MVLGLLLLFEQVETVELVGKLLEVLQLDLTTLQILFEMGVVRGAGGIFQRLVALVDVVRRGVLPLLGGEKRGVFPCVRPQLGPSPQPARALIDLFGLLYHVFGVHVVQ